MSVMVVITYQKDRNLYPQICCYINMLSFYLDFFSDSGKFAAAGPDVRPCSELPSGICGARREARFYPQRAGGWAAAAGVGADTCAVGASRSGRSEFMSFGH